MAKAAIQKGIATDEAVTVDNNIYTAQFEHTLPQLMPRHLKVLQ